MIRRHGHYIQESRSKNDPNNHAVCLKCGESFSTASGRASRTWVFDRPCRGTWRGALLQIKRFFEEAEKNEKFVRKWIAFDTEQTIRRGMKERVAEARQRGGFGLGGSPAPLSQRNAAKRRR